MTSDVRSVESEPLTLLALLVLEINATSLVRLSARNKYGFIYVHGFMAPRVSATLISAQLRAGGVPVWTLSPLLVCLSVGLNKVYIHTCTCTDVHAHMDTCTCTCTMHMHMHDAHAHARCTCTCTCNMLTCACACACTTYVRMCTCNMHMHIHDMHV